MRASYDSCVSSDYTPRFMKNILCIHLPVIILYVDRWIVECCEPTPLVIFEALENEKQHEVPFQVIRNIDSRTSNQALVIKPADIEQRA